VGYLERPEDSRPPAVVVTGMSGTGKSTLLAALARRGWTAVDADDPSWCRWEDGDDPGWFWREERILQLVDAPRLAPLVVAGTVPNLGIVHWDLRLLLSVPLDVMLERIATRTGNDYGKTDEERSLVIAHHRDVEPRLRVWADIELDGTRPVDLLADDVIALL
jgi:thymidylate kinase